MKFNKVFKNNESNFIIKLLNYQISKSPELKALITDKISNNSIDWIEFLRPLSSKSCQFLARYFQLKLGIRYNSFILIISLFLKPLILNSPSIMVFRSSSSSS